MTRACVISEWIERKMTGAEGGGGGEGETGEESLSDSVSPIDGHLLLAETLATSMFQVCTARNFRIKPLV